MKRHEKVPDDFEVPHDYRVIDYSFHLGDLIGGTAHLTNAQYGGYMRILIAMVQKPEGLTMKKLKSYSRMTGRHWGDFWDVVGDKFVEKDGIIYHERVREQVRKQAYKSVQNTANALKRWNSDDADALPDESQGTTNHLTTKPHKDSLVGYDVMLFVKDLEYDDLKREFPGWDIAEFVRAFNDMIRRKGTRPAAPYPALRGYIAKVTKGKTP